MKLYIYFLLLFITVYIMRKFPTINLGGNHKDKLSDDEASNMSPVMRKSVFGVSNQV